MKRRPDTYHNGVTRADNGFPLFVGMPNRRTRKLWERMVRRWSNERGTVGRRQVAEDKAWPTPTAS